MTSHLPRRHKNRGYTLSEVLMVVSIIAILASIAAPSFALMLDLQRAQSAVRELVDLLNLARYESIHLRRAVTVTYATDSGTAWSVGASDRGECDPEENDPDAEAACSILKGTSRSLILARSSEFPNITLDANRETTRFDPIRGTATGSNVTLRVQTSSGQEIRIIVGNIGRIRTCSPADLTHINGYPSC